jgi:hypothetical protein
MPTKDVDVSLDNWMDGDVLARFDAALERLLKNCMDPNYDASPRKLKLTVKLTPNNRRDELYPEFHLEAVNGRLKFVGAALRIGIDERGRGVAREYVDAQQQLFNKKAIPSYNGWKLADDTTRQMIRDGGWSEITRKEGDA